MNETLLLIALAGGAGVFHTMIGPDHYLPFIMMARARHWHLSRTLLITALCGIGHVLSSVVLGLVGIAGLVAITSVKGFEDARGSIAAWLLIAFGIIYAVWGLRQAIRNKPHTHAHFHPSGDEHAHEHVHHGDHTHVHDAPARKSITPWVLFVIFVFGPCEVLIPMMVGVKDKGSWSAVLALVAVFGIATIGTMVATVTLATIGVRQIRLGFLERYAHVLAGSIIAASGLAIQFLGL
ncbi:MAG: urease accessory protein UreH domain-containing protein [Planctomycetota bacterium]|jgi:ABC-type nickel/cobalt efflux system permease component RcnA